MKPFMQSLRESGILILSMLVLLVSFGVYYYVYVQNNQSYLTQRNLRQLNAVTAKTESTIAALVVAISNQNKANPSARGDGFFETLPNAVHVGTDTGMYLRAADNEVWLANVVAAPPAGATSAQNGKRVDVRSLTNTESLHAVFDIVLLMDARGEILYQPGNALHDLTILNLDTLIAEGGGSVLPSQTGRATGVSSIVIAGVGYRIFSQPLRLPAALRVGKGPWAMVGLTTVEHFRKESMKVSYDVLIIFVFLIFFVGLCWPLLKLVFIGPNEELRPAEVTFLVVTTLLGTSLITILTVNYFCFRVSLVHEMDGQLSSFAETVQGNLRHELGNAVNQLEDLNRTFPAARIRPPARVGDILRYSDSSYFPAAYPYLEMMYVVDDTGGQIKKWSVRKKTTPLISVRDRPYYQSVLDGRLWSIDGAAGGAREFSLEPHLSWTTGAFESALAISREQGNGKKGLVAMNTGPWSLYQTTVMRGFGYCIMDGEGGVLYHSDTSRNLSENLFDECDNDHDLIAIVRARNAGYVKVDYGGSTHAMYVLPIQGLPWFIVTFRNEDIVKSADAEIISVAMLMFIAYAAIFFVLFALAFLRRHWRVDWAWPVEGRRYLYIRMVVLYVGISVVFLLLRGFNASADTLLGTTIALPLIAVFLTYAEVSPGLAMPVWHERHRKTLAWISMAALGVLLVLLLSGCRFLLPWFVCLAVLAGGITFLKSTRSEEAVSRMWLPVLAFVVFAYVVSLVLPMGFLQGGSPVTVAASLGGVALLGTGLWWLVRRCRRLPLPGYRTAYAAAGMSILFLAAVQPALNFYRVTFDEQMKLFVKYEQLRLAVDLQRRSDHLRARYATIEPARGLFAERSRDFLDVYAGFFFSTNPAAPAQTGDECAQGVTEEVIIPFIMPSYDTLASQMRALGDCVAADASWRWGFSRETRVLTFTKKSFISPQQGDQSVSVSSIVPGYVRGMGGLPFIGWVALVLTQCALMWALFALVTYLMNSVFLVDVNPPIGPALSWVPRRTNVLVLGPVAAGFRAALSPSSGFSVVDLMKLKKPDEWRGHVSGSKANQVVVDHLEAVRNDAAREEELLKFLEEIVFSRQRNVILVSAVDPLTLVSRQYPAGPQAGSDVLRVERAAEQWDALMGSFVRMRDYPVRAGTGFALAIDRKYPLPQNAAVNSFLKTECGNDPFLQDIVLEMIGKEFGGNGEGEQEEVVRDRFVAAVRKYYNALWSACSRAERRVLIALSINGYASPSSGRSLDQLMRNSLVVRRPALRLMNDTFRAFVLEVQRPGDRFALEPQSRASLWMRLRAPIMLSVVAALLFLYATQREALNSTAAFITAAAGLLPALLRLLGVFQGGNSRAPGDA